MSERRVCKFSQREVRQGDQYDIPIEGTANPVRAVHVRYGKPRLQGIPSCPLARLARETRGFNDKPGGIQGSSDGVCGECLHSYHAHLTERGDSQIP